MNVWANIDISDVYSLDILFSFEGNIKKKLSLKPNRLIFFLEALFTQLRRYSQCLFVQTTYPIVLSAQEARDASERRVRKLSSQHGGASGRC